MSANSAFTKLDQLGKKLEALDHAQSMLFVDEAVMMPTGGAAAIHSGPPFAPFARGRSKRARMLRFAAHCAPCACRLRPDPDALNDPA